jgi:tRNA(Glu) U13 pseudouridine synthase TruD
LDTKDAAQIISRTLNININDVTFAGTKDKRAITYQRCCVKNRDEMEIAKSYKKFNTDKVRIGGP